MTGRYLAGALIALGAAATPVTATSLAKLGPSEAAGKTSYPPYLQCVPYARRGTGVQIYGDAHTWWGQADGRYAKGGVPKVGAVMSFRANGSSRLGHVAAVSKLVDSRNLLISHANWSPINGRRGQIEKNVRAMDVSKDNDWSSVRVWYGPIKALGARHWRLNGFIYNTKPGRQAAPKLAQETRRKDNAQRVEAAAPGEARSGKTKLKAISAERDPIGAIIARARR